MPAGEHPHAALEDVTATLGTMGIKWKKQGALCIKCTEDSRDIIFELRIVPLLPKELASAAAGEQHKLDLKRLLNGSLPLQLSDFASIT